MKKRKVKKKVRSKKKVARKIKKKKVVKKVKKKVVKRKKRRRVSAPRKEAKAAKVVSPGVSLEEVGVVTHYFPRVEAAVVKLTKGTLSVGDTIIVKGHTTDFKEKVESLQLNHVPINSGSIGQEIGLKVKSKVREHDVVYKVVS